MNQRLLELEKEGKYLFHGSGFKMEKLEPRQAHSYPNKNDEGKIPDGEPAVFAADRSDIAVFMAIISPPNAQKGLRSGFTETKGQMKFRVTKETMDQIDNAKGYVYVFDKDDFTQRGTSHEWVSNNPVSPVEIVEVTEKDLPDNIEVKQF